LPTRGYGLRVTADPSVTKQKIRPGTVRRILPYALPYRWRLLLLGFVTALDALITVVTPLLLRAVIDNGIERKDVKVIVTIAIAVSVLACIDTLALLIQAWASALIGQSITYDLRLQVFKHVRKQPLAFFTRTQTGSLVSRLNTDVVSAQQAITTMLSTVISSVLTLVLVLITMFLLSWRVTVFALLIIPVFVIPTRLVGRKLQRLTREAMQRTAEMGSMMNERFNVAGALHVKLYGRDESEDAFFAYKADRVREVGVTRSIYGQSLYITLSLVATLALALVYGYGGTRVVAREFQIGTLVALVALLGRMYSPISQLSNLQVNLMTALVSFDRTFEVLDLKPLVVDKPGAVDLPAVTSAGNGAAPDIEFDQVSFRYPSAEEVALASLESIAAPSTNRKRESGEVLREVTFVAPAGKLSALVGSSGAGKTTIIHLLSRMYDPNSGAVRIGGHDIRDVTLASLRATLGVVTQDAYLFHDTIRSNLDFARPGVSEEEMIKACKAAQIWNLISSLPDGLDTVVGDRGYRLSGGEKQRVALARLLLKSAPVVVLDEATAHLDYESEAAIKRALQIALAGKTSLVIAHRLSTIRRADQILVVSNGQIAQRGTHEDLLASGGIYADLYYSEFAKQAALEDGNGQSMEKREPSSGIQG
jgi:ATP-binding cassette, subfamily B, bacterial